MPAPDHPDSDTTSIWGRLRVARSLPAHLIIAHRALLPCLASSSAVMYSTLFTSVHPPPPPAADADPSCTLGLPVTREDALPASDFPGWACTRWIQMSFDGAGGVTSLGRVEVRRCEMATTADSAACRVPWVSLMESIEGYFKIPAFIATSRVSVTTTSEALYVHRMFRFLSGTADHVSVAPAPSAVDFQ